MASHSDPNENQAGGQGQDQGQAENGLGRNLQPGQVEVGAQAESPPISNRIAPTTPRQARRTAGLNINQARGPRRERPPSPDFVDEEGTECVVTRRPVWLWFLAIADMVIVALVLAMPGSSHEGITWNNRWDNTTQTGQVALSNNVEGGEGSLISLLKTLFQYEEYEGWTIAGLIISLALLSQFFMGFMLFIALCIPSDNLYMICLTGYLYGSYFILCKVFVSLFSSVTLANKTKKLGRILGNVMTLLMRLPITMMIQDLLGMCNSPEAEQPEAEPPRVRDFRRRLRPHRGPHLPLTFATKTTSGDETETSL